MMHGGLWLAVHRLLWVRGLLPMGVLWYGGWQLCRVGLRHGTVDKGVAQVPLEHLAGSGTAEGG